jgi:hypothetical protein
MFSEEQRAAINAKLTVPAAVYALKEALVDLRMHLEVKVDGKAALKDLNFATESWRQLKDALGLKEGWVTPEIEEEFKKRVAVLNGLY